MVTLRELLEIMVKKGASDLHLTVGAPPMIRLDGKLTKLDFDRLNPDITKKLAYSMMSEKQKQKFEENSELDLSFGVENLSRFRTNIFVQRGNVSVAMRQIPYRVKSFEELGIPKVIQEFAEYPRGLVLVCGPTGSGKSTTLAAIIDKVNRERNEHILTVEDPHRFDKNRMIGPFLGLTPKRDQSGETDKALPITKAGDEFVRRLLAQSAQYILGHHGPDCDLRKHGQKIAQKGGKAGKKKAVTAVSRKLAVLLLHLWKTGDVYDPFYKQTAKQNKKARKAA